MVVVLPSLDVRDETDESSSHFSAITEHQRKTRTLSIDEQYVSDFWLGCARPRMINIEYVAIAIREAHGTARSFIQLFRTPSRSRLSPDRNSRECPRSEAVRDVSRHFVALRFSDSSVVESSLNSSISASPSSEVTRHIAGPPSRGQFRRWPAVSRGGASRASPSRWASPSRISGSRSPSCPESPASPAAGFAKLAAGFVSPWVAS